MTNKEIITQRVQDFNFAFDSVQGQRVLAYISQYCLKDDCTYVQDSDKSIFNQGARSVILEIDDLINYDLSLLETTGETDNKEPERTQDE